jgi:hypothetical protein
MIRHACYLFLVLLATSCGSGSSSVPAPLIPDRSLRISSSQTDGADGDALAAALLLSSNRPGYRVDRSRITMSNTLLQDQLVGFAQTHLRVNTFGGAPGPSLGSSATMLRKASQVGAPSDQNQNGTNVDETLAAEFAAFSAMAGGPIETANGTRLFSWRQGSSDFATSGADGDVTRATLALTEGQVSIEKMARAMLARTLLGTGLLQRNRGSRPGETAAEAVLGLSLLRQALAIEETLFTNLFMDGLAPGLLPFPSDYDPTLGVRWLPSVVSVSNGHPGGFGPSSYRAIDVASSLNTLAALLRAGGELSYYASDHNPNPNLRDIFRGSPFGPKPGGGTGSSGTAFDASGRQLVTWEGGVGQFLNLWCSGCHSGIVPQGEFRTDSYTAVHQGGTNSAPTSATPIITRGDPANSVLYYILKANPPRPFSQMPSGGQVPPAKLKLIEDWITDGARSAPPGPPAIGLDLAIVSYKNLVALHLDPSGGLYERNDVDAPPTGHVDVASTGEVLQALAGMDHLKSELPDYRVNLQKIADFVLRHLSDQNGVVFRSYDMSSSQAGETADLFEQARITTGLLAASRVLQAGDVEARGRAVGQRLLDDFFDSASGMFRSRAGEQGHRYSPLELAAVVDALREMAQAGMTGAVLAHEAFLSRLTSVLVYSETEATGEIVGDGIADTDGDGIAEPAYAGGDFGRAPVFAGEIKKGLELPVVGNPVLWTTHILPLLQTACAQCHLGGANQGDYRMDTPSELRKRGSSNPGMPLVVPGDPEASYLYRKLVDRSPAAGDQMPLQQPPISPYGKELVRRWILEGATSR